MSEKMKENVFKIKNIELINKDGTKNVLSELLKTLIIELDENIQIKNIFCIDDFLSDEKNQNNNNNKTLYTDEGIRQQFTETEIKLFNPTSGQNTYYVYIGICSHGNIIEVGMTHFPYPNNWHGDWVKKVELKNSNIPLLNHVLPEMKLKDLSGTKIVEKMNEDYKNIIFIPLEKPTKGHAKEVEKVIHKKLTSKTSKERLNYFGVLYFDSERN